MNTETALLAACLTKPSILWQCDVEPQHFTSEANAAIWTALQDLTRKGEPFDAVTVSQHLGGELGSRVIGLVNDGMATPAAAPGHARKLVQNWRENRMRDICAEAIDGQIDHDQLIRSLMALNTQQERFETDIQAAMKRALEDMEEAAAAEGKLRGITTGLTDLDKHLGGWHNGDLSVIGARPAMGKTALMLHHAARCGVPMGVISTEQPAYQIAQRHIASIG